MEELPAEIITGLVGYLPPIDAIRFGSTYKALHSKLSLTVTPARQIIHSFIEHDRNDDPHYGFQIPTTPQDTVAHSCCLMMNWRDQGWGNRKSRVFVVAEEMGRVHDRSSGGHEGRNKSNERFGGGKVVYSSAIALHEEQMLAVVFTPKQNETYHCWYAVGGGGGHSILLRDVRVQALVIDDSSRSFANALARAGEFAPWDAVEDADQFLQSQRDNQHAPPALASNFSKGSDVPDEQKVSGLAQSLRESYALERIAYEQAVSERQQRARRIDGWYEDEGWSDYGEDY